MAKAQTLENGLRRIETMMKENGRRFSKENVDRSPKGTNGYGKEEKQKGKKAARSWKMVFYLVFAQIASLVRVNCFRRLHDATPSLIAMYGRRKVYGRLFALHAETVIHNLCENIEWHSELYCQRRHVHEL